jgi:hypothetical protein
VLIVGAVAKTDQAVYRCVLKEAGDSRPLEIPQWMLDAAACCQMALTATPAVTWQALRAVRALVENACRPAEPAVLQARHLAMPDPGGACATHESTARGAADGPVSAACNNTAVGGRRQGREVGDE